MAEGVGIAVVGASGRMGRMLVRAVTETPGAWLSGATERPGNRWVGRDIGEAVGGPALGVIVEDDPLEVFARSQAVLDFTSPEATMQHAELAAQARLVHVIGTTGLERPELERLAAAARHAVIVRAGNMSVVGRFSILKSGSIGCGRSSSGGGCVTVTTAGGGVCARADPPSVRTETAVRPASTKLVFTRISQTHPPDSREGAAVRVCKMRTAAMPGDRPIGRGPRLRAP